MIFFSLLIEQILFILPYWILGIFIGSAISVFGKEKINNFIEKYKNKNIGFLSLFIASLIGIVSPLCLYGTIPVAASLSENGVKDDWLAAFMMSSILLNPQLLIYTMSLGLNIAIIRFILCLIGGVLAGFLVSFFNRDKSFFLFQKIQSSKNRDVHNNLFIRYFYNIGRNIKATGFYFLVGIILATLFLFFLPNEIVHTFTQKYKILQIFVMVIAGIPFYVCGGGSIPLLAGWMKMGLSTGAALSFTVSGSTTKITNLTAMKMVLDFRHIVFYVVFVCIFALLSGIIVEILPSEWKNPRINSINFSHMKHHNIKGYHGK